MTTLATGRQAEDAAAVYLRRKGCDIMAQNWRTPACEIDIVAQRNGTVYLCEVKYRRTANQGTGLDYITPRKLKQMRFAAELWVQANKWTGPYELCAIEVSGPQFAITGVVKDL